MAAVGDLRGLFLHELGDIVYAERKILDMLGDLLETTSDGELRQGSPRADTPSRG